MRSGISIAAMVGAIGGLATYLREPGQPEKAVEVPRRKPSEGLRRADVMATARAMATHRWVCGRSNRVNRCVPGYESDWRDGETVQGIAYNWGGIDGPERFDAKLQRGYSAGAHSWHGVNRCSAGIDCSGFVSWCWGIRDSHRYTTRNLHELGVAQRLDPYRDLLPGDALVKPGSHTVLFAGYRADGHPNAYEATGTPGRVIFNQRFTWSHYRGYYPVRCRWIVD